MSGADIAARNRANATKSTGPRTAAGKAKVARNARRHGATAQPDAEAVCTWLRIILGKPELEMSDFLVSDDRGHAALILARAEAQLAACTEAVRQIEENPRTLHPDIWATLGPSDSWEPAPSEFVKTAAQLRRSRKNTVRANKLIVDMTQPGGERHRLDLRYLAEARSHRKKAFAAWVPHATGKLKVSDERQRPKSRNKARSQRKEAGRFR